MPMVAGVVLSVRLKLHNLFSFALWDRGLLTLFSPVSIKSRAIAASATVLPKTPTVSKLEDSGIIPR